MVETPSEADLHQLLVPSTYEPPRLPRKGTPPSRSDSNGDAYSVPDTLSRTNSMYSFSRASFTSQMSSLSSMTLPKGTDLASGIASASSATKAVRGLNKAAEQIQSWTKKALRMLKNLDADDDVEWAAAAGRDGLDEVDKTVSDFEELITAYVTSIEELQTRKDIGDVRSEQLQAVVETMETTLEGWDQVRSNLKGIHDQVELAMEFQELWNDVLGEVGNELDSLSGLVFEMEEKRHMASQIAPRANVNDTINLTELESVLGDSSKKRSTPNARFSLPPAFESSPLGSPIIEGPSDDTDLLGLFARMQPLKASLDFLPMRLSLFYSRAEKVFPHACEEIREKSARLRKNWEQLSKDAENLRRELSEDRWVVVFRNAGRQAAKMCESVERSIAKVQEAINEGYQRTNPAALAKRTESFEAKKMHYGPAVQRVISIISKGLKERLTINGEILRLHKDMSARAQEMIDSMEDMESLLESMHANHDSNLRESISTIVSAERSFSSTTFMDTPGSSPASSVDLTPVQPENIKPKYGLNGYSKTRAPSNPKPPIISGRRSSILAQPRRPTTPMSNRSGSTIHKRSASPATPSVYRQGSYAPPTATTTRPAPTPVVSKPRWSSTINANTTPNTSGYPRLTTRASSLASAIPLRSPLSRETSVSPSLPALTAVQKEPRQYRSFAERVASPTPRQNSLLDPVPYHRGRNFTAPAASGTIRSPSALAMHSRPGSNRTNEQLPGAGPPLSSLNQVRGPQTPQSIPKRTSSVLPQNPAAKSNLSVQSRSPHAREDSGVDLDIDHRGFQSSLLLPQSIDTPAQSYFPEMDADEVTSQGGPGSSPLTAKKKSSRPSPRAAKRISMLPIPSGRGSSLGHRRHGS